VSAGRRWAGGLAITAAFIWSAWSTEMSLGRLLEGIPFMLDFVGRMLPPDLRVLGQALRGALQTLQIAVAGTALGAVLALPVAFAAARNTSPRWTFYWTRSALNAFRAMSPGGTFRVAVGRIADAAGDRVEVQFEDQGVGIAPENLGRIFEPGFTTHAGSPGLGLAVTKKIIEQHGGAVHVVSATGRGAIFILSFPLPGGMG